MNFMNIMLDDEEYQYLVTLVQLGHWMTNGIRTEEEHIFQFDAIQQHILSYASEGGLDGFFDFDKKNKKYTPTEDFETKSGIEEIKRVYEDEIFWSELIERLAQRDFKNEYTEEEISHMSGRELLEKRTVYLQKYIVEFQQNELKNIQLKT